MEQIVKGQRLDNVPSAQAQPRRLTQAEVLDRVGEVYGVSRAAILSREHAESYQCCVYLLRRAANIPLKKVARLFGISPSRISHIQRELESRELNETERWIMAQCKVKQ